MATMPAGSTSQDVARRLTDDGYVVVTGMMTPDGVQSARADLDRVLRTTRTGRNSFEGFDTQRIYALFAKTRVFDALATDPLLLGVLDQVLGHYQLSAPVGICIGPGEKAQILHRDDAIYPVPEPHPPLVVNTMWPLDEFTGQNGATRFIPGSHRWEPGRSPGPDDPVETAVMSPGSALFYLGSLWHGGGANTTARPRLGVILEYAAGWLRPQENHCLAVPRSIVRDLPERLQELLGYNIFPPFVGYVDGRHPRRVLLEQGRWSGGNRLGERLDLGHPGSHLVVEPAGQLERGDVVGRMDEHGRGTPLAQPAAHGAEPGLPPLDGPGRVVPADVADDGMGRQGP
jgi:ectoine hydroxylase-related dioxygenase (phytanoyl-CoA dioxygenase family)